MESKTTSIARINGIEIVMIENGDKYIAVKPICDLLGVAWEPQFRKLKSDPKFSSVITLRVTTGSDGKQYEMITIPFKKVFGWLYSINANNVKEESRENLMRYQEECNDALYNYFARHEGYLKRREQLLAESFEKQERARLDFNQAKNVLEEAKQDFRNAFQYSERDYLLETHQLEFDFGKEEAHE